MFPPVATDDIEETCLEESADLLDGTSGNIARSSTAKPAQVLYVTI
jgi:hypothetical protein